MLIRWEGTCGPCEGGPEVSEAPRLTAARESRRRAGLPAAASGANPAAAGAVAVVGGRGVDPGARAEFVRRISGAMEWQGGGFTEAQRPGAAERGAARRARVWASRAWRMGDGRSGDPVNRAAKA